MPYGIFKTGGRKPHCVYKVDSDGNRTGDSLGCHTSRASAGRQIAAIEASEAKTKKALTMPESLNATINRVSQAWWDEHKRGWVAEVFADHIVVGMDKKFFRVSYTEGESGASFVDMNEWEQVQPASDWVPVSKALEMPAENQVHKTAPLGDKLALKSIGDNRIGGYLVLWGSQEEADFSGEWFSPQTKGLTGLFDQMGQLPWLVDHGADDVVKETVFGVVDTIFPDEIGLWHEIQVKKAKLYETLIKPLVDAGKMGCSSGCLPATRQVDPETGEIKRWVIAESTGTVTPMDWRQVAHRPFAELKAAFAEIGIDIGNEETFVKSLSVDEEMEETEQEDKGAEKARLAAQIRQDQLALELLLLEEV